MTTFIIANTENEKDYFTLVIDAFHNDSGHCSNSHRVINIR